MQVKSDRIPPAVLAIDSRGFFLLFEKNNSDCVGASLDTSVSPMYNIPTKTHM